MVAWFGDDPPRRGSTALPVTQFISHGFFHAFSVVLLLCIVAGITTNAAAQIDVPAGRGGFCATSLARVGFFAIAVPLAFAAVAAVGAALIHLRAVRLGKRQSPPHTSTWALWGYALIFSSATWVVGIIIAHWPFWCENYYNAVGWWTNYGRWVLLSLFLAFLPFLVTLIGVAFHSIRRSAT